MYEIAVQKKKKKGMRLRVFCRVKKVENTPLYLKSVANTTAAIEWCIHRMFLWLLANSRS